MPLRIFGYSPCGKKDCTVQANRLDCAVHFERDTFAESPQATQRGRQCIRHRVDESARQCTRHRVDESARQFI